LGLIVGSFLNCVIYRFTLREPSSLNNKELGSFSSFAKGRSFCPHCKHTLSWPDLIPVFSFLFLGGKCRYCSKRISWQYPAVEISTALIFLLISNFQFSIFNKFSIFNFQTILYLVYLFITSSLLIVIFVYDLKHYIIPDSIIFSAIGLVFLFWILDFGICNLFGIWCFEFEILNPLISGLVAAGLFLFIILVSRGKWMGMGDVKLAFFMGLFLGFPQIIVALFLAFLIGAIIGTGLVLAKKRVLKSEVPFGPFLVTGTFIAFFWGEEIIQWYLNLFNF